MVAFLLKKIGYGLSVLAGVVILVFLLFQGFGDPSRLILGQRADASTRENIRKELNLDQPKWKQFILYLNDVSPLCVYDPVEIAEKNLEGAFFTIHHKSVGVKWPYLRRSYQTKKLVSQMLATTFPGTLLLALTAMLIATVLGIPLGVLAAVKKGKWQDTASVVTSILGISAPSFFMGIIVAFLFGFLWSDITGLNMNGSLYETDPFSGKYIELKNLILPAFTLGIRPMAIITQLTRSAMLEVLKQDYIRTAKAKGLSFSSRIWKHALRNALNPVITAITGWFAELLAGAFFVEYIFGWRGVGKLTVEALEKLDFPVVMGAVLLSSCFFILINLLADLLYALVDPRIRKS